MTDADHYAERLAELIRENLMLRSKLAAHGVMPPALRKPFARRASSLTPLKQITAPVFRITGRRGE
jgi:hypothetical protein